MSRIARRTLLGALCGALLWLTACATAQKPAAPVAAPTRATAVATVVPSPAPTVFDGQRALDQIAAQLALGPRYPGSPGHLALRALITAELEALGWEVEQQAFDYQGFTAVNLIARANQDKQPVVLLGAHYDTRARADQDIPEKQDQPVPGAIDGGSGVAVLLELARVLDLTAVDRQVWLLFFDVEDNGGGGLPGWDWIAGSRYLADNLTIAPEAMVLVDMVGQVEQELYYEGNSDPALQAELWALAAELGFGDDYIPQLKYTMIDDHVPFAERGIPAVDIIDFDYLYWHTTADTLDKASAVSLYRVGRLLQVWLER